VSGGLLSYRDLLGLNNGSLPYFSLVIGPWGAAASKLHAKDVKVLLDCLFGGTLIYTVEV